MGARSPDRLDKSHVYLCVQIQVFYSCLQCFLQCFPNLLHLRAVMSAAVPVETLLPTTMSLSDLIATVVDNPSGFGPSNEHLPPQFKE